MSTGGALTQSLLTGADRPLGGWAGRSGAVTRRGSRAVVVGVCVVVLMMADGVGGDVGNFAVVGGGAGVGFAGTVRSGAGPQGTAAVTSDERS